MSRRIEIQVQMTHTAVAVSHIDALLHVIHAVAGKGSGRVAVRVNAAEDYCNLSIDVVHPKKTWRDLSNAIAEDPRLRSWLKSRWIVVLQGKLDWKDYVLLAHFDAAARLDPIA